MDGRHDGCPKGMYPFDPERALAGEDLVTRGGWPAKGFRRLTPSEGEEPYSVYAAWIGTGDDHDHDHDHDHDDLDWDGESTFTSEGKFSFSEDEAERDLFMKRPPSPPEPPSRVPRRNFPRRPVGDRSAGGQPALERRSPGG